MVSNKATLLLATVFLVLVKESVQLQCYACSGADSKKINGKDIIDTPCGDLADNLLTTCGANELCLKTVTTVDGNSAVVRACGPATVCEALNEGTAPDGVDMECFSCDSDKCNSATGVTVTTILLLPALFFAKFY